MKTIYLFAALAALAFVNRGPASHDEAGSMDEPHRDPDTLTARVVTWHHLKSGKEKEGVSREVLRGATRDLSLLDIRAFTLDAGQSTAAGGQPSSASKASHNGKSSPATGQAANADLLVIVKEGSLTVTLPSPTEDNPPVSPKVLDAGGVALFAAGSSPQFTNASTAAVTYYLFRFQSRSPEDRGRARQAGPPFLLDWKEMEMKKTDKGESRQIFNRSLAWLGKIDMHATTLNPGEVSHAPHIHRAEEIILMRSGHVQEYIGGQYHKASAGDLIFLPSGVPHALENKSNQRCEYFALQWQG